MEDTSILPESPDSAPNAQALAFPKRPDCLRPLGLILRGGILFEEWEELGNFLAVCDGAVQFWIGDWCNYGEAAYGEKYAQALDAERWSYQTLRDSAWVARQIPLSRRVDGLSFAHHREVSPLEADEQDVLLHEALKNGWSRQELREAVKAYKRVLANPNGQPSDNDQQPAAPGATPGAHESVAPGATNRQRAPIPPSAYDEPRQDDAGPSDLSVADAEMMAGALGPDDVDPQAEWERAERELGEAQARIALLEADDARKALADEREKYVRLEGRLQLEMATRSKAENDARYAKGMLAKIRLALSVESDREIIPAIEVLRLR